MKVQLFLPATIVASVVLVGVIKLREMEQEKEDKRQMFVDIKLRVTNDVLREYQSERTEMRKELDTATTQHKTLEEELRTARMASEKAKSQAETCVGGQKSARDDLATVETEYNDLKAATDKEVSSWKTEVETLKKQLAARSPVCNFLKQHSQAASKLCGEEVSVETPKEETSKAETPKQEEPKTDAPKQEPKTEAPKEGEPKAEAPKQEEPKAEAPKQEAKA